MNGPQASLGGLVILGIAALFSACAQATGTVSGGEALFDAAPPPVGVQTCDIDGDAGLGGSKWSDLYRDFFGPTGLASCAGDGACHGDASQAGSKASAGYVCGADKDACRNTLFSSQLVAVPPPADPTQTGFIQQLRRRKPDGTIIGDMPKRPTCIFEPAAIDRISLWIKNGAPND